MCEVRSPRGYPRGQSIRLTEGQEPRQLPARAASLAGRTLSAISLNWACCQSQVQGPVLVPSVGSCTTCWFEELGQSPECIVVLGDRVLCFLISRELIPFLISPTITGPKSPTWMGCFGSSILGRAQTWNHCPQPVPLDSPRVQPTGAGMGPLPWEALPSCLQVSSQAHFSQDTLIGRGPRDVTQPACSCIKYTNYILKESRKRGTLA